MFFIFYSDKMIIFAACFERNAINPSSMNPHLKTNKFIVNIVDELKMSAFFHFI